MKDKKEIKGFKAHKINDFLEMDFSKERDIGERGYRRGYRHGYNNGLDDSHYLNKTWAQLCKFFDNKIMPWSYFKGKYRENNDSYPFPPDIRKKD